MTNIDTRDFNRALEGIEYPVSRDAVLRAAADKGGLNGGVQIVLRRLPDTTYDNEGELMHAIDAAYLEHEGLLEEATPAAPAHPAGKDAAAARAETHL